MSEFFVTYGIEDDYEYSCGDLGSFREAQADAIEVLIEWCESTIEAEAEGMIGFPEQHEAAYQEIVSRNCERYLAQIRKVILAKPDEHGQTTFEGPVPGEIIHINES